MKTIQDVDFEMYTEDCSTAHNSDFKVEAYEMYGASPWQRVPGILEMYGMCSYRNWYEYLELVNPRYQARREANEPGVCDGNLAERTGCIPGSFDIAKANWWSTDRPRVYTTSQTIDEVFSQFSQNAP